jgi:hypothetical protein
MFVPPIKRLKKAAAWDILIVIHPGDVGKEYFRQPQIL